MSKDKSKTLFADHIREVGLLKDFTMVESALSADKSAGGSLGSIIKKSDFLLKIEGYVKMKFAQKEDVEKEKYSLAEKLLRHIEVFYGLNNTTVKDVYNLKAELSRTLSSLDAIVTKYNKRPSSLTKYIEDILGLVNKHCESIEKLAQQKSSLNYSKRKMPASPTASPAPSPS